MYKDKLNIDTIRSLYWQEQRGIKEIAERLDVSFWSLYNFMNKNHIYRRSSSEVSYVVNKIRPQFQIKNNLNIAEEKLKIAGVMLYWAEGTLKGNTVDFANSSPEMVRLFLKFLREICGVSDERLRIYLYAYSYHDLKELKKYWRCVTGIPISQFTRPYVRKGNSNLSRRKLPYGLVHIRYNDKRLLALIEDWVHEYIKWTGTQVAKGGRLSKGSVLPKGMMEK